MEKSVKKLNVQLVKNKIGNYIKNTLQNSFQKFDENVEEFGGDIE